MYIYIYYFIKYKKIVDYYYVNYFLEFRIVYFYFIYYCGLGWYLKKVFGRNKKKIKVFFVDYSEMIRVLCWGVMLGYFVL